MANQHVGIVGGTLLDGQGNPPRPDTTVLVDGSRIVAVGPRAETPIPAGARQLAANGHTILPGLIDLHQHVLDDWDKAIFPRRGITSIRFAGGKQSAIRALRDRIRSGAQVGPRIYSVGPTIDLPPTARPQSALVVSGPAEAEREARRLIEQEQVDALFAARRIDAATLRVLLEVAHSYGKPVTGQVFELSARQAAEIGIDGLENTSRIPESPAFDQATLHAYRSVSHRLAMMGRLWATAPEGLMQEILGTLAAHRVEWAAGQVSFEHWAGFLEAELAADPDYQRSPAHLKQGYRDQEQDLSRDYDAETRADWQRGLERMRHWIRYYDSIGGPVVTGTDTPFGYVTYHRELRHLQQAGFSNAEIIVAATSRSAHALRQGDLGVVEPGMLADLIVVPGDPLRDLSVLREPTHVLVDGRVEVADRQLRLPEPISTASDDG